MDIESDTNNLRSRTNAEEMDNDLLKFVSYQPERDSIGDARNTLLVVAALIVAVTFDKVTSFPDGITGIMKLFLMFNTLAFSASMAMIEFLTNGFPFERELRISIAAVTIAYGIAAASNLKEYGTESYFFVVLTMLIPYLFRIIPIWLSD